MHVSDVFTYIGVLVLYIFMQLNCANGQKNVMSHVFFNTPEGTLIGLLHDGPSEYWGVYLYCSCTLNGQQSCCF